MTATRTRHRASAKPRANPEHRLQVEIKQFLTYCLPLDGPDYVEWTSSLAGAHLGMSQRVKAKAAGLRPGFPDLQFILPDRTVRFIELKAPKGVLSFEQKRIRNMLAPEHWACCRSVDEVEATLRGWGVKLRSHPFNLLVADDNGRPFPADAPSHEVLL